MLLDSESIHSREKLSLALWSRDRFITDDVLGRFEFDLGPLVRCTGQVFHRTESLIGRSNELKKEGRLKWSVAFFEEIPIHNMNCRMSQKRTKNDTDESANEQFTNEPKKRKSSEQQSQSNDGVSPQSSNSSPSVDDVDPLAS